MSYQKQSSRNYQHNVRVRARKIPLFNSPGQQAYRCPDCGNQSMGALGKTRCPKCKSLNLQRRLRNGSYLKADEWSSVDSKTSPDLLKFNPNWIFFFDSRAHRVDVPEEQWADFKAWMPPEYMPKNHRILDVHNVWRPPNDAKFERMFPRSHGVFHAVNLHIKGWRLLEAIYREHRTAMVGVSGIR